MKRIFSILTLFFVLTTSAYAEHEKFNYNSQKPITCTTPERVKEVLGNMLGELPYFQGEGTAPALDGKTFIDLTPSFTIIFFRIFKNFFGFF